MPRTRRRAAGREVVTVLGLCSDALDGPVGGPYVELHARWAGGLLGAVHLAVGDLQVDALTGSEVGGGVTALGWGEAGPGIQRPAHHPHRSLALVADDHLEHLRELQVPRPLEREGRRGPAGPSTGCHDHDGDEGDEQRERPAERGGEPPSAAHRLPPRPRSSIRSSPVLLAAGIASEEARTGIPILGSRGRPFSR